MPHTAAPPPPPRPGFRRALPAFALVAALGSGAADADESLRTLVERFSIQQTQGLPGKVGVQVGQLDPRTQLPPCSAHEPFLPAGGRLWGKSTVGVRCLGPANWTVYIPVTVSVSGNYYLTARPIAGGQTLNAGDITPRNGDLTALPASIVTDATQVIGKTLRNSVAGGQPLRSDLLLSPLTIQQGQTVKLISRGNGFNVSSEGKALNNAAAGQLVQVRVASGQTIGGIARSDGMVEVNH